VKISQNLTIKKNIKKEVADFHELDENSPTLDVQLDRLIDLLNKSDLDSQKVSQMRDKFDSAMDKIQVKRREVFSNSGEELLDSGAREEMLDNIQLLLATHELDSKQYRNYRLEIRLKKIIMSIISVVLIILGFAMIIMPAPPYFEMFTIFYFSKDDGVTLMDIISLLIILSGVYLLIKSLFFKPQAYI
jgi:hypothetical protein